MQITRKRLLIYLILIITSLFLVIDIPANKGIFTAHDNENSIFYFGSFYESIMEGNIIPRWGANIANLFGSPTLMFFYPLSFYMMIPFRLFGFSLIDCMKLIFFLSFVLSGLFMHLWLRKHFSRLASLTGSFLYMFAPYRINDIYARGSMAECMSFMLLPVLLLTIHHLHKKKTAPAVIIFSVILAFMVLAHPFMVIVFAPLLILYVIFLGISKQFIFKLMIGLVLCFGLTAYYSIPMMTENKYTHYDMSRFRGEEYFREFIDLSKMVEPKWRFIDSMGKLEYQTYQIGLIQIFIFLTASVLLTRALIFGKLSRDQVRLFLLSFFCFVFSVFIMHKVSDPLYRLFFFLRRIQFPWRFLGLNLFSVSILAALLIDQIKSDKIKPILIMVFFACALLLYQPYARGHGYKIVTDSYYLTQITENTDAFSTLPIWAAQPDKYPRDPDRYKVIEGDALVELLKRTSTYHSYYIRANTPVYFADQTFYFPGWKVLVNGKQIGIEFQDQAYRGIIAFRLPRGEYFVEVIFGYTKIRLISDIISIITIIFITIYVVTISKRRHHHTSV